MNYYLKIAGAAKKIKALLDDENQAGESEMLHQLINKAQHTNKWFTPDAIQQRLLAISTYLQSSQFEEFCNSSISKKQHIAYGIVCSENIPLEAFPTLLAVLLTGNSFVYKTTELSDKVLVYFFTLLGNLIPEWQDNIHFQNKPLRNSDAFIIYQDAVPNQAIVSYTKERNTFLIPYSKAVAIVSGKENVNEMEALATDIFLYFGKGRGNVGKIYIPNGYNFESFYPHIENWNTLLNHNAYMNNYQYQQSVYLLNRVEHLDNGFLLVRNEISMISPTGVLFYEHYSNADEIHNSLLQNDSSIYCNYLISCLPFGSSIEQELKPEEKLMNFLQS